VKVVSLHSPAESGLFSLFVLTVLLLAVPTHLRSEEAFRTDCILYLHGHPVPMVTVDSTRGYLVTKTGSSVSVNGVVYYEPIDVVPQTRIVTHPNEPVEDVLEEAIRQIWNRVTLSNDETIVTLDGTPVYDNIKYAVKLKGRKEEVDVTFYGSGFTVYCQGNQVGAPNKRPPIIPKDEEIAAALEKKYSQMVYGLSPGRLVVAGVGYFNTYPRMKKDEVISALKQVSTRTELTTSENGSTRYKSVTIDGYYFTSDLVRDFVRK
jgi:hypothetical protein